MGGRRNFFMGGGQRRHFAYRFWVSDDALQMDVYETLCSFYSKKIPRVTATVKKCASLAAIARYITIIYTIAYMQIFKAGHFFTKKHCHDL